MNWTVINTFTNLYILIILLIYKYDWKIRISFNKTLWREIPYSLTVWFYHNPCYATGILTIPFWKESWINDKRR